MAERRFKDYEDYFMNRTVADIMEEYSGQKDEWVTVSLNSDTEEPDKTDEK